MRKDRAIEIDNKLISKIKVSYDDGTENVIKKGVAISLIDETPKKITVGFDFCNIKEQQELMAIVDTMLQWACEFGIIDDLINCNDKEFKDD